MGSSLLFFLFLFSLTLPSFSVATGWLIIIISNTHYLQFVSGAPEFGLVKALVIVISGWPTDISFKLVAVPDPDSAESSRGVSSLLATVAIFCCHGLAD